MSHSTTFSHVGAFSLVDPVISGEDTCKVTGLDKQTFSAYKCKYFLTLQF